MENIRRELIFWENSRNYLCEYSMQLLKDRVYQINTSYQKETDKKQHLIYTSCGFVLYNYLEKK